MNSPSAQKHHQMSQIVIEGQQSCKDLQISSNFMKTDKKSVSSPKCNGLLPIQQEDHHHQQQQPPLKMFKELERSHEIQVRNMNNINNQRNTFFSGKTESYLRSPSENNLAREQKQPGINSNTLSVADQDVNYFPSQHSKPHFPPPPTRDHEDPGGSTNQRQVSGSRDHTEPWSCHRCTLINNNSSVCCEVCGATRGETEEDTQPEQFRQAEYFAENVVIFGHPGT